MSYIWSGTSGAGIITSAEGVASFGGQRNGDLIASDTYVDPQEPLAWLARFYGANVDAQNITVMSGGTLYANNGTYTNLQIGPKGSASISSSYIPR